MVHTGVSKPIDYTEQEIKTYAVGYLEIMYLFELNDESRQHQIKREVIEWMHDHEIFPDYVREVSIPYGPRKDQKTHGLWFDRAEDKVSFMLRWTK